MDGHRYASFARNTALACAGLASGALGQSYALVNCRSDGVHDLSGGFGDWLSDDGRVVAFITSSPFVVPGDANNLADWFVRDRDAATTELVAVSTGGVQVNAPIFPRAMSRDGRYFVFETRASSLDPADTNGESDYYLRDRLLGTTEIISLNAAGSVTQSEHTGAVAISDDGRYVAFFTLDHGMVAGFDSYAQLLCRDRMTGTNEILTLDPQGLPAICCAWISSRRAFSADGRYVLFTSGSFNLVPGDTNGERDVFVRDRVLGVTERISLAYDGAQALQDCDATDISPDGRFVVFRTWAPNMVANDGYAGEDVFVRDRQFATTRIASITWNGSAPNGPSNDGRITADGRLVSFTTGAGNMTVDGASRVVRDQIAQTTTSLLFLGPPAAFVIQWSQDLRFLLAGGNPSGLIPNVANSGDLVLVDRQGTDAFASYCTAKQNSAACLPVISCSGLPSLSGSDDAFITSWGQLEGKPGVFFWGSSAAAIPFGGGMLCIQPPLTRTGVQDSTSQPNGNPCDGTYSFHLTHAYMASEGLVAGTTIFGQWWGRDPGFAPPANLSLSDGLAVTILP